MPDVISNIRFIVYFFYFKFVFSFASIFYTKGRVGLCALQCVTTRFQHFNGAHNIVIAIVLSSLNRTWNLHYRFPFNVVLLSCFIRGLFSSAKNCTCWLNRDLFKIGIYGICVDTSQSQYFDRSVCHFATHFIFLFCHWFCV